MKHLASLLLAATVFTACNIDREPYSSISAEKIRQNPSDYLESLDNGVYAQLKTWSDPMHRCGEYAGDNMMIRGSSTDSFYEFISFSRTPQNGRLKSFWDASYKAIAQASNIINLVPEGSDAEINNKLGECYYVRGLMYFYLVRAYGRPYAQSPSTNLGVPIVNGTPERVDGNLHFDDRATVEATYQQVIKDLEKAIQLLTLDRGPAYASRTAAEALLSRVYLYMSGTYESPNRQYAEKAEEYATKVISSGKYQLLDRESFMKYNTILPENNRESIFVVRRRASEYSGYDHYYGVGGMYANIGGMGWGEMFASAKYIALLDENGRNDWRPDHKRIVDARAAFIEPNYKRQKDGSLTPVFRFIREEVDAKTGQTVQNYLQLPLKSNAPGAVIVSEQANNSTTDYTLKPVNANEDKYSIDYKGKTYSGYLDYEIKLNRVYPEFYIVKCSREGEDSHLHPPVISRLGEVYLNRAEARAKLGKYSDALTDLNTIRTRSIVGGGYTALDAKTAPERIDKERQLELAFQAERSYDVFRNGKALERRYPGPHNQSEVIQATDYRVVYYIPQNAINAYPGTLTQNPTSN